ncbi:ATPase, AAA family [Campylobacter pinnipediorum subsp. pinnipediorum]|uniref:ATP-binding protein n=1 Tax=Campylobacter pinnipediorum TaxID=1965231 RepID=UPI000994D875|nr:ATP-binding protein [Campylobacter pinnipediorum]AQW81962.1 ATPase, AAA family [Campylobacter pinnipediorum subsp. pinnipediorum]AQW85155.1 ATPase, AAA family [Campylobacter pinnipediorum subsp. pinnipediorum]
MQYLIDFLNSNEKDIGISKILNTSEEQTKILRHLSKSYVDGVFSLSVFDILSSVFTIENFSHIEHLKDIKSLIENGWIVQNFGVFRTEQKISQSLLPLLNCEVSLSLNFLKILEDGDLNLELPNAVAYDENLQYLKDQFLRIELYEKKSLLSAKSEVKLKINNQISKLEDYIKQRIELSKIDIVTEQIFKDNTLNEKEELIFLTLLRQEYSNDFENQRELDNLISLVSEDEFECVKNRSLLDDNSKLLDSGLIEYDEILNSYSTISKNFFINEDVLQSIMHPKNSKKEKKIKVDSIIKDYQIFELIEPTTNINDVVLNKKTKELLDTILKQVDKKVLNRLNTWGIKNRKSIDAKIIFYGEAGTGKTMSAVSLAKSLKKQVLSFDCSKILSKYVGESEQNVRKIFDSYNEICKKTKTEPVLLLNEADQFLSTRIESSNGAEKMHNQMQNIFLEQIERFNGVLIATTNFLQTLDSAFSRRFDYKIEFKKPDFDSRLTIWRKVLPQNADFEDNFDIKNLAKYNLSGAQIVLVMKNTALKVAVKDEPIFLFDDFKSTIERELSSAFGEDKKVGFGS